MPTDDAHGFDFIYGSWDVHNHKLRDVTDPDCNDWVDFEATSEAFPICTGQVTSAACMCPIRPTATRSRG